MPDFTTFIQSLTGHLSSPDHRREIADEMRDHLEEAALDLQAQGFSPDEARTLAMQRFGDPETIGKELGRVHNRIQFRHFAVGGVLWYIAGALLYETGAFFINTDGLPVPHWLAELPFQVLGLPHWFAKQAPQIRDLPVLGPLERFLGNSLGISSAHIDAVVGAAILTAAAYGVYRLARALKAPEARQAFSLLRTALRN